MTCHSEDDEEVTDYSRFGIYTPVLSESPYASGVAHIPKTPPVPPSITVPPYARTQSGIPNSSPGDSIIQLGSSDEEAMRKACKLASRVLSYAGSLVHPGVATSSIDSAVHSYIISHGAYPSPLGYRGFPKSCCTSVNNVIVHGIPDSRKLEEGDIINIDITVYLDGFHGDCSQTFPVGYVDEPGVELLAVTHRALQAGIDACGPGKPFKGIGLAISSLVNKYGYSVNGEASGHGIGRDFHRTPWILHHKNDEPGIMQPGHCFTIEPAVVQGDDARGWMLPDGWTVLTETFARAAQKEHTVLITETGVDVLTKSDEPAVQP